MAVVISIAPPVSAQEALTPEDNKRLFTPFYDPNSVEACASSASLVGAENAEKIWNFFIGKGLQPFQVAGMLGNMEAESGFNPRRVEGTAPGTGDSDTPDRRGYGIVQFTPGTKILPASKRLNMSPGDLGFQVTLIWEQLNGQSEIPEKAAGDHLKQTTNVEDATRSFEYKYERHDESLKGQEAMRIANARKWLAKFGSGATTGGGGGEIGSSCGGGTFNYGKYASLSRDELINIILNAPNWRPQGPGPNRDIQSGAASDNLLRLLAALVESLPSELITPSVIQTGHSCRSSSGNISNHMGGLAVDLGGAGHSQQSMNNIFTWLHTNSAALGINELIYEPPPPGTSTLKHGKPLVYDSGVRAGHRDHIHVSVAGSPPASCPAGT